MFPHRLSPLACDGEYVDAGVSGTILDLERGMVQVRQHAWRGKLGDPKTMERAFEKISRFVASE
jgi:hypothetical protein